MLDIETVAQMEINAPLEHQRVISQLLGTLSHRYYNEKTLPLEPLPETMLNPDQTSPVPDVSLYDNEHEETHVIIEVTHSRMVKADLRKVQRLIDNDDYGIKEGFVFDYKKNQWHKYKKGVGAVLENPSFCDTLSMDFAALLPLR